jgi:hypothetical protein
MNIFHQPEERQAHLPCMRPKCAFAAVDKLDELNSFTAIAACLKKGQDRDRASSN